MCVKQQMQYFCERKQSDFWEFGAGVQYELIKRKKYGFFLHVLAMHSIRWSQGSLSYIFYFSSEAGWTIMKFPSAGLALPPRCWGSAGWGREEEKGSLGSTAQCWRVRIRKQNVGVEWVVGAWGEWSKVLGVSLKMRTEVIMVVIPAFLKLSHWVLA